MAAWKQALVAVCVIVAAAILWVRFDTEAAGRLVGWGVPASVVALVAPEQPKGADAAKAGGPSPAGAGRRGPGGPAPVLTAEVTEAITNDRVRAIGTGEAVKTVKLFPRASGMVTTVGFTAGQKVEGGTVLLQLDDDAEAIALQKAEVTLADAQRKVDRYDRLASGSAVSAVDRETARSELASANLAVRQARLDLDHRIVRAPFAGVLGLSNVEVGDLVTSTTEIATIDDRSRLKVEFRVPEIYASDVSLDQQVDATTPSRPGKVFHGTVMAIGSRVEADSRTLPIQAAIDNEDDDLRPGMSFLVELHFSGDRFPEVPSVAVQWDKQGTFVWRIQDGVAERVGVTIVERNMTTTLVAGDLKPGDIVVQEGVMRLRPGAKVLDVEVPTTAPAPDNGGRTANPDKVSSESSSLKAPG